MIRGRCSPTRNSRVAPATTSLPHHRHERAHSRHHSRGDRALAAVHRFDRGGRSALLPLGGGQGRAIRGQAIAPDFRRARRLGHTRDLSQRHLDQSALRRAAGIRAHHRGVRKCTHHAARICHRVRFLRSARFEVQLGEQISRRFVFRGPDQRHHRLRGGCGPRLVGRHQCRARSAAEEKPGTPSAARPTSACWSTI